MNIDSGTPEGTGTTVADAADRIASLLGPADSEVDETQEDEPSDAAEDDAEALEGDDADTEEGEPSDAAEDDAEALEGDDADTEEGEPSDEQDEPEEDQEQPTLYTVKVAGEEVQVTLDELQKGYSREQDYVRKTMALADQRKAAEAEVAQRRDDYSAKLDIVSQIIEAAQPKVDQSLRATNPAEWAAQMLQHKQWAEQRQGVEAERERLRQEADAEHQNQRQERASAAIQQLRGQFPEWADDEAWEKADMEHGAYAEKQGLSTEDVLKLDNPAAAVAVLRKAMLYDELMTKKEGVKAAVAAKKVAKPGVATPPASRAREIVRAKDRLRQSGRVDDAAAAIERLMG